MLLHGLRYFVKADETRSVSSIKYCNDTFRGAYHYADFRIHFTIPFCVYEYGFGVCLALYVKPWAVKEVNDFLLYSKGLGIGFRWT